MAEGGFDFVEFLKMEAKAANQRHLKDYRVKPPPAKHRYVDDDGYILFDDRYDPTARARKKQKKTHPKVLAARRNKTTSGALEAWFEGMPPGVNIPIAGTSKDGLGMGPHHAECLSETFFAVSVTHTQSHPVEKSPAYHTYI